MTVVVNADSVLHSQMKWGPSVLLKNLLIYEQEAMAHQLGIALFRPQPLRKNLFMLGCKIMAEMMRCIFLGLSKHDPETSPRFTAHLHRESGREIRLESK